MWLWPGMLGPPGLRHVPQAEREEEALAPDSPWLSLCFWGPLSVLELIPTCLGPEGCGFCLREGRRTTCSTPPAGGGVWLGAAWLPSNARWESWGLGVLEVSWQRQLMSWSCRAFRRPWRPSPALQLAYSTPCCRFLEAHWTLGKKKVAKTAKMASNPSACKGAGRAALLPGASNTILTHY